MPGTLQQSVLVVDDDQDVRRLVVSILQKLPLKVFSAGNAEEALQIINSLPAPPDLLLTDVVMPGVNGPALAEQVLRTCPKTRVLFMSGFDNRLLTKRFSSFPLLLKPFTLNSLGQKVTEILSGTIPKLQLNG